MSYELIAILMTSFIETGGIVGALVYARRGFREMSRNFEEISRIQRAVAGLVAQESEKIQQLLRV